MGKKSKKSSGLPFVSICTPTYNRRPFIEYAIKCFEHQDYPKDKMEWIIIDDGTDKIEDLVKHIPQVKYYSYDKKMPLGKKRNIMHEKSKGSILVYMDDDDYYPPERVSHAVDMLKKNPQCMAAGSSEIYIYFKHIQKMYQFGPYGENHATAGTFAFRRELLKTSSYDDKACLAEEKNFMKNFTIPMIQLDPKKVILVVSHDHNTFDKKRLLDNPHPKVVRVSDKTVDDFIKEDHMKDFYMNKIDNLLKDYAPGRPDMKPDVLKQIKEIDIEREVMMKKMVEENMSQPTPIVIQQPGQPPKQLNMNEVQQLMQQQQQMLKNSQELNNKLIMELQQKNMMLQNMNQVIGDLQEQLREKKNINLEISD